MNKKNKKFFLGSLSVLSPIVITPAIISCSYNVYGQLSRPEQIEMLNDAKSKDVVFNNWLTDTFTSLYMKHILKQNDKKKGEDIRNFLFYLDGKNQPSLSALNETEKNDLAKIIYRAYKFFVTYRSSISTSDSQQDSSDVISSTTSTYFPQKVLEWQKNKYATENGESLDELSTLVNTGVLKTMEIDKWKEDKIFKLIFTAHGTEIYTNVLKMLIAEIYFLNSSEEEIKLGTDYNKQTKNELSIEWYRANTFNIKESTYFLTKYLVEKNPQFKWSYSSDNATFNNNISSISDFNNLMGPTKKTINEFVAPFSNDTFNNGSEQSLSEIRGFSNFELNSTVTDGDLSNNIDLMSTFSSFKSGVLNNENKFLYSFNELNAINAILSSKDSKKFYLPKISLDQDSITKKTVNTIEKTDIIMEGSNTSSKEGNTILKDSEKNQKWEITKISFAPQNIEKIENQKITISVKYTFDENGKNYEINYSFDIAWNNTGIQSNLFNKQYYFDNKNDKPTENQNLNQLNSLFPSVINSLVDGKLNISYILRPLPIFEWNWESAQTETIEFNKKAYMNGKWKLDNTIWNNIDKQKNLVHWFILNDTNLWKTIQDFYLFNNYDIDPSIIEIKQHVEALGLTKKTNSDRRNAGIIS